MPNRADKGPSINHLVLSVRDIDNSHQFYTDVLGFERCGELSRTDFGSMWFYRGHPTSHHDIALVQIQTENEHPIPLWTGMLPAPTPGLNHIAIGYPSREEWLDRLSQIKLNGVEFLVRGNHGMTHSAYIRDPDGNLIEVLYDLPAEVWTADVNAALNYFEVLPTDGPESLQDNTAYHQFIAAEV